MIDPKALEAAARAMHLPICGIERDTLVSALTDAEMESLAQAAITAYLNSPPIGDEAGLVKRLRAIDEEAMYQAPATTHATVNEAADTITRLLWEPRVARGGKWKFWLADEGSVIIVACILLAIGIYGLITTP
jgi:hypothetical protein